MYKSLKTKQEQRPSSHQFCDWKRKQDLPRFQFLVTPQLFQTRTLTFTPSFVSFTQTDLYPEKISPKCFPKTKRSQHVSLGKESVKGFKEYFYYLLVLCWPTDVPPTPPRLRNASQDISCDFLSPKSCLGLQRHVYWMLRKASFEGTKPHAEEHSVWCSAVAILKFSVILNKGSCTIFILPTAPQIMQLVLMDWSSNYTYTSTCLRKS